MQQDTSAELQQQQQHARKSSSLSTSSSSRVRFNESRNASVEIEMLPSNNNSNNETGTSAMVDISSVLTTAPTTTISPTTPQPRILSTLSNFIKKSKKYQIFEEEAFDTTNNNGDNSALDKQDASQRIASALEVSMEKELAKSGLGKVDDLDKKFAEGAEGVNNLFAQRDHDDANADSGSDYEDSEDRNITADLSRTLLQEAARSRISSSPVSASASIPQAATADATSASSSSPTAGSSLHSHNNREGAIIGSSGGLLTTTEEHIVEYAERVEIAACLLLDAFHNRSPNHRVDKTSRKLLHIKNHPLYRGLLAAMIVTNLALALFEQPYALYPASTVVTHIIELICLTILSVETFFLFMIEKTRIGWLKKKWNIFRTAIIVVAYIDCIGSFVFTGHWYRFARITRVVFFVGLSNTLRSNFSHIVRSSFSMLEVIINILYNTCFFAVIGVTMFSHIDPKNFGTFTDAFLSLFVCLTTANFPDVMLPVYRANPLNCLYFITYLIIGIYVIVNRAIAVVYTHYRSSAKKEALNKYKRRRRTLWTVFKLLDKSNSNTIRIDEWFALYKYFRPDASASSSNNSKLGGRRNAYQEAINMLKLSAALQLQEEQQQQQRNNKSPNSNSNNNNNNNNRDPTAISFPQFLKLSDMLINELSFHNELVYTAATITSQLPACFSRIKLFADKASIPQLLPILDHKAYEVSVSGLILLNCIFTIIQLSLSDGSASAAKSRVFDIIDTVFLGVFTLELFLRFLAHGGIEFWKSGWNIFDFFVIVTSIAAKIIIELILTVIFATNSPSTIIRLLRVIRIIRMIRSIRIFSVSKRLKLIISTYIDLAAPLFYFSLMVLVVFYVYGIMGMELFGGVLTPERLKGTDYDALNYYNCITFNNLAATYVTMFHLLIVNNWHVTMFGTMRATSVWACIYFISFYLVTVIMLMNLVIAFFLEIFQYNWDLRQEEAKREREQRKLRAKQHKMRKNKQQQEQQKQSGGDTFSEASSTRKSLDFAYQQQDHQQQQVDIANKKEGGVQVDLELEEMEGLDKKVVAAARQRPSSSLMTRIFERELQGENVDEEEEQYQ